MCDSWLDLRLKYSASKEYSGHLLGNVILRLVLPKSTVHGPMLICKLLMISRDKYKNLRMYI